MSNVIVIEDDMMLAQALGGFISDLGYSVSVTYDIPPALELAKREAPDLILMDVWYAHSTEEFGNVVAEFRKLSPDVRIVAMVGRELSPKLAPLFNYVLKKPFELHQVLALLHQQEDMLTPRPFENAGTTKKGHRLAATGIIKILFLAANPSDTTRLRVDKEIRAIDQALMQTEFREMFDIKQHWAVRVADLQGYLLRHKPDIVHFSGHGSVESEIILEDDDGNGRPISVRALSQLFSVLRDNIRCVVLNACYSEQQATAIAEHIDFVIGMSKSIGDSAAISFATAFYQALGFGRNIQTAFDLGCLQIDMENLSEQDTPKLISKRCNPKDVVFVHSE